MRPLKSLALAAVVLVAAFATAAPARADDGFTWSVKTAANSFGNARANYSYTLNRGGRIADALVIVNRGAEPLDLDVSAADAFTTAAGRLDLLAQGQRSTGVGAWVHAGRRHVHVGPRQSLQVPFTLEVPPGAKTGDHVGGVVTSLAPGADGVTRRLGIRIRLRVAGRITPSLSVDDLRVHQPATANPFAKSDATITYALHNTGNAILAARQSAALTGPFGSFRARAGRLADSPPLLPGETRKVSVPVRDVVPAVRLTANVRVVPLLTDAAGSTAGLTAVKATTHAWAIPWALLLVVLAVAGLVVVLVAVTVRRRRAAVVVAVIALLLLPVASANAHGFSSVVYVDATSPEKGHVRTALGLEYDLLVVSTAENEHDDALFKAGTPAWEARDRAKMAAALDAHSGSVLAYVTKRFDVTGKGAECTPRQDGGFTMEQRDGVPYALLVLDYRCPGAGGVHELHSGLFPDSEGYVRDTKTIVTYDLDLRHGSASLDAKHPSFSTHQSLAQQYGEFFRLGAHHLLGGLDHILFLLALIAGSRRLREIVLTATTFTLAHSVTFILAALGLVYVNPSLVEPVIALSIAVVAGLHLWRLWRRRTHAAELSTGGNRFLGLDNAGLIRLGVVFCFGLVHGLGFASALGIDQAWSWTLLSSLFVFNAGIEVVQLGIISLVFPVLALLRHRAPLAGLSATGAIAAGVCAAGMVWFVERGLQI